MKKALVALVTLAAVAAFVGPLYSHCEMPCGIYDDEARIKAIDEQITTIEKSMKQITALSKAGEKNYNQLIRWVGNKEETAGELQHVVTQYFMTQRVKPADPANAAAYAKYVKQLTLLHQMLVEAMKAKQTTDLAHVEALRSLLGQFKAAYFQKSVAAAPAHEHSH